jgi:hypothetical protein
MVNASEASHLDALATLGPLGRDTLISVESRTYTPRLLPGSRQALRQGDGASVSFHLCPRDENEVAPSTSRHMTITRGSTGGGKQWHVRL